jgi:protoporphyrinogen oxidase
MAEDVVAHDNKVLLQSQVIGLAYHGRNNIEVIYLRDGQKKGIKATEVVSTIPLGRLVLMLEPACDSPAVDAARSLEFRDLITVNLVLKKTSFPRYLALHSGREHYIRQDARAKKLELGNGRRR